eukprot:764867-Hanusia_phi.AAC.2
MQSVFKFQVIVCVACGMSEQLPFDDTPGVIVVELPEKTKEVQDYLQKYAYAANYNYFPPCEVAKKFLAQYGTSYDKCTDGELVELYESLHFLHTSRIGRSRGSGFVHHEEYILSQAQDAITAHFPKKYLDLLLGEMKRRLLECVPTKKTAFVGQVEAPVPIDIKIAEFTEQMKEFDPKFTTVYQAVVPLLQKYGTSLECYPDASLFDLYDGMLVIRKTSIRVCSCCALDSFHRKLRTIHSEVEEYSECDALGEIKRRLRLGIRVQ